MKARRKRETRRRSPVAKRLDKSDNEQSMHRLVNSLLKALLGCVVMFLAVVCSGYTYRQVGIDSNFLIDTGRVFFAQADGSLTVLALETGEVLRRDASRDYSGTLMRVPPGILVLNYGTITLYDPNALTPLWETKFHYSPNVVGDALVSYDGNGLVQCRNL